MNPQAWGKTLKGSLYCLNLVAKASRSGLENPRSIFVGSSQRLGPELKVVPALVSAAMNAFVNTAGVLIPIGIAITDAMAKDKDPGPIMTVEVGVGIGEAANLGNIHAGSVKAGSVPAVSLFDANGYRMGQAIPGKTEKIQPGTADQIPISVGSAGGQPEYLQLTTMCKDAICINHVGVSGAGVEWVWTGDIAYTCGGDWYPSTAKFGTDTATPKCAWLDADHSDRLRFIAMSMHMPDFNGDQGLADEYTQHKENLCNSKARFMQWGKLFTNPGQNSVPPIFNPPLQYNSDGSEVDPAALFKGGTVQRRDQVPDNSTSVMDGSIDRPGHLVVSDHEGHSAQEVCGSETSCDPSFVSTSEGYYCDVSTKTAYALCSATTTTDCFNLQTQQLVGRKLDARDTSGRVRK